MKPWNTVISVDVFATSLKKGVRGLKELVWRSWKSRVARGA